jgi:hypothetical protein
MIEQSREVYVGDVVATLFDNTSASTTLAFTGASDIIYTAPNTHQDKPLTSAAILSYSATGLCRWCA